MTPLLSRRLATGLACLAFVALAACGDDLQRAFVRQRKHEIDETAVHPRGHGVAREPRTDRARRILRGRALGKREALSVGQMHDDRTSRPADIFSRRKHGE